MKTTDWQAIIFDFDGVVVESGEIKTQAFADLYQSHGEHVVAEVVDYHTRNGGMSRYRKFRYFQKTFLDMPPLTDSEEQMLDRQFSKLVVEAVIACKAVAGVNELIQQQSTRIPLFVASGTPEVELKVIVEQRGLASYFKEVRGAPALKQTIIAEFLSSYSLTPEKVLMIGDAIADYEGAQANGTAFLGRVLPGDKNPFPADVETVPDLCAMVN